MTAEVELCVGAITVRDDALLMVERGSAPQPGRWSLPGGRVEPGESLYEAAAREVREETGLDIVVGDLVGWVELISTDHHFVVLDFWAQPLDDRDPEPGSDATKADWVPLHQVCERPLVDGLAEFLSHHGVIRTFA